MKRAIEYEDDEVVRDGQRVVVPVFMMDSLQRSVAAASAAPPQAFHKPTAVRISDADRAQRASLYQGYDAKIGERWKSPTPALPAATDAKPAEGPGADQAATYAAYEHRVSNAWRRP